MKLFRQLLVAPAALGLMAPMAANAAELNVNGVSDYSATSEVQSISNFSDVYPTDWAYQALTNLAERHGCVAGNPSGSMTRYEAAALLNNCLGNVAQVNEEERRLINEFGPELAVIKGRIDGLEAGITELEAGVFSTTTKLSGTTKFVVGAATEVAEGEAVHMNYDTILNLNTSFTGEDLLVTSVRAGNFGDNTPWTGSAALETAYGSDDALQINRNYYQFPIGDELTATVGAKVRQDDMLAVWPSDYPSDTVLDVMTYAGAPAAYNLALGAGAGISYSNNGFSASLTYVATEGDSASAGLMTEEGGDDVTAQLAYVNDGFGVAAAYTSSDKESGDYDALGLSAFWTPSEAGAVPSISGGFGVENPDDGDDEFTWTVGLQWSDVGAAGNNLGLGIGSADGWIDDSDDDEPMAYELWYQIAVSDNITVTPAVFNIEQDGDDITGGIVKTTFRF